MQLQGLPTRNRTRILWITKQVLSHWATEAVAGNLRASSVYIYIYIYILMRYIIINIPLYLTCITISLISIYIQNSLPSCRHPYKNSTWTCSKITCEHVWLHVWSHLITCDDMWFWNMFMRNFVRDGFCSSVVEHWSSNPEDAGSITSRKALELHFSQLIPVWVL